MITPSKNISAILTQLVNYLAVRRESLLNNWRTACETDPSITGSASLSREEFNSKVPLMLNMLELQLQGYEEEAHVGQLAAEHGFHRWQKGYDLAELSAEMQHLSNLLLEELRLFWELDPTTCEAMPVVYEHFFRYANQINTASIRQYAELQRTAASNRVEALEKALTQLNEAGKQRSDLLRHSSHDLRGSFGVIQGAATLLELVIDSQEERKQMLDMLLRNLNNCHLLVTQMIDLARLEAGKEVLNIQSIDAGQLLTNLVALYQPLAAERRLLLKADGPASLPVDCDPVQLQRIIQNLVLNALKHTLTGWVLVSWMRENDSRWIVNVQDSGPGLPQAGSLGQVMPFSKSTIAYTKANFTEEAREVATTQASGSAFSYQEGIGLSIVRGLCELLRANLEIESKPGEGTLFRIRFAIQWQS